MSATYTYDPVMFDRMEGPAHLAPGTTVVKVQPFGCPKNGTMGMTYVEGLDGTFYGLVMINSLTRKGRTS